MMVRDEIIRGGGAAGIFQADIRDPDQVSRLIMEVKSDLGSVDILVINAAGPQPLIPIERLTWQDCVDQMEFFVKSPVLLVKEAIGDMKKSHHGRIIQIGSEVFEKGIPNFSNYVAAKAAQLGLTRSWAMELAPWQITVNLVAPGWIPTERHADDSQEEKERYALGVPMGRMGEARDVAGTVAFLASDRARFITGQKISVNGGNTLE